MKKILVLFVLLTHVGLFGCATTQEATTAVANTAEEKKAIESNISEQTAVVEKQAESIQAPIERSPSASQVHEQGKSTQVPRETLPSASPAPTSLTVKKNANIRSQATIKSKILMTAKKGTKVEYLGKSGKWLNVRLSTGLTGWIFWDLVTEEK